MPLYGGIDLHANNSVIVLLNEQDEVIYQKRLPNNLSPFNIVIAGRAARTSTHDRHSRIQCLEAVLL